MSGATFSEISDCDLAHVVELEAASYPSDEAATPEKIRFRATNARPYFLVAKVGSEVVGFVNGTCIHGKTIAHSSMSNHEAAGRTLVIHSVVVAPHFRRKQIGQELLRAYLSHLHSARLADDVLLLCKSSLLQFYLAAGFQYKKVSDVVHGQDQWIEMALNLRDFFGLDQWQVDAFADRPFVGNPAAIVLVHKEDSWMQNLATENNLAETSFLEKVGEDRYKLRWFTPTKEVMLCGHATLAAAHCLLENGFVSGKNPVVFESVCSGELIAEFVDPQTIQLTFPSTPVQPIEVTGSQREALRAAFSLSDDSAILSVGRSLYDLVVELDSVAFHAISEVNYSALTVFGDRGVVITCAGQSLGGVAHERFDRQFDFYSRCFFPILGINEDPVTGSAHCALCPYWTDRARGLGLSVGRMVGIQDSPRGGIVSVQLVGDRVLLAGSCVTTMKTKLYV